MPIMNYLHCIPVILAVSALIAFFTSYGMAVRAKHVDSLFPYISDAGARPPESCIFGQFLNFAAVLAFISMYIHYKHIKEFNITQMPRVQQVNNWSLWLAAFACIGMSMVANFQYVNSEIPHFIGAFMVFGLGILYCWLQSFISYRMRALGMSSTLTTVTRTILSLLATIFFLITSIAGPIAMSQRQDKTNTTSSPTPVAPTSSSHWNNSLKGYDSHLASTFSEWLMAISFLIFFLTYFREFQKISLSIKLSPKNSEIFCNTDTYDNSRVM